MIIRAEVGRTKRSFNAIITPISFAAMRYDKGREFYFSRTQRDGTGMADKVNASIELRVRCKDTCPTNPLLVADGVCSDGGYADLVDITEMEEDEVKCPMGTDCSDCARLPLNP